MNVRTLTDYLESCPLDADVLIGARGSDLPGANDAERAADQRRQRSLRRHVEAVERRKHAVVIDSDTVGCPCGLKLKRDAFGADYARRIAHAHIGNPVLPVVDLMAFVSAEPSS